MFILVLFLFFFFLIFLLNILLLFLLLKLFINFILDDFVGLFQGFLTDLEHLLFVASDHEA